MEEKCPTRRWFRFSLRGLFAVTTLAALGCWVWLRSVTFAERAAHHAERMDHWSMAQMHVGGVDESALRHQAHHWQLYEKYQRAARYPWLPVEPDPPEPQP